MTPNRIRKTAILLLILAAGCSSPDRRLTRMAEQQARLNEEMVKLNRDVAQGLTKITQENAEFRKEALAIQKQLHAQRVELIQKQEALAEERRRYAQRDPLVAKAVTHVGLILACLLPLGLSWLLLRQPVDEQVEPVVNELLLQDLTSDRPVLVAPVMCDGPPRLALAAGNEGGNVDPAPAIPAPTA